MSDGRSVGRLVGRSVGLYRKMHENEQKPSHRDAEGASSCPAGPVTTWIKMNKLRGATRRALSISIRGFFLTEAKQKMAIFIH